MKNRGRKIFTNNKFLFVALVAFCFVSVKDTYAATFSTSSCDPDYYDSLEARAWLEAQREITQNQNLIFKPDSVLEYTCFDRHINQAVSSASSLFSEDTRWGTAAGNMSSALSSLASANSSFNTSNFDHNYLGGRSSSDYSMSSSASSGSYNCNVMNTVWQQAKCMDFIDRAAHDSFFTFREYHDNDDMRRLPTACTGSTSVGPSPGAHNADFWTRMARATGGDLNNDGTIDPGEGTTWNEDAVATYFYLFNRGTGSDSCGNSTNASAGMFNTSRVRTGLVISRTNANPAHYNEYICLVPGCFYHPTGTSGSVTSPSNSGVCCRPGTSGGGCP